MTERIVLRGGLVVDGTGAPGTRADVAIEGDRIAEVGTDLAGDRSVDASGCVVAPGFIDIHTHYDAQVFWDPWLTPSCHHGVTTVVAGNCGFTMAPIRPTDHELIALTLEKVEDMDPATLAAGVPWDFESFPEYLTSIRSRRTVLNFGAYIGHTALRLYVMGSEASEREATPEEIERMAGLVREAMAAGAVGFSSSSAVTHLGADGNPIPSRRASEDEILALSRAVGESGRGVVGLNGGGQLSFSRVYELQAAIGAPVTYSALLTTPTGGHFKALEIHRKGRSAGRDVRPQVTCRPLSFSINLAEPFTLNSNPEFSALMTRPTVERRSAYADPQWRQRVQAAWERGEGLRPRWDTFEVMESGAHPEHVGARIHALAEARGVDPLDVVLDLALSEPDLAAFRVKAILANDDAEGVAALLREPGCVLGLSDAGAHVGQICDAVLPTDLLANWVRDRGVLSVEEAVRKLTADQAQLFGFADRGVVRPGAMADLVVFDPEKVAPGPLRRTRDFPAGGERLTADAPVGIRHVMVNGTLIRADEQEATLDPSARPGRVVSPAPR